MKKRENQGNLGVREKVKRNKANCGSLQVLFCVCMYERLCVCVDVSQKHQPVGLSKLDSESILKAQNNLEALIVKQTLSCTTLIQRLSSYLLPRERDSKRESKRERDGVGLSVQ